MGTLGCHHQGVDKSVCRWIVPLRFPVDSISYVLNFDRTNRMHVQPLLLSFQHPCLRLALRVWSCRPSVILLVGLLGPSLWLRHYFGIWLHWWEDWGALAVIVCRRTLGLGSVCILRHRTRWKVFYVPKWVRQCSLSEVWSQLLNPVCTMVWNHHSE